MIRRTQLAAVLLATIAVSASAQLRDRDPAIASERAISGDLQGANFHRGAFYLLSRITLSDIGYNEEFFAPTGEQTNGVSIGISAPQRLYFVPQKKIVLSGDLVPSYSFITGHSRRGQAGYLVRGDARLLLNHIFLDVYSSSSNQLRANTGELNSIVTVRETSAGTAGELKYSSRTSLTFAGGYRSSLYPTSQVQPDPTLFVVTRLNSHDISLRGSLIHKTFPLTSLRLVASTDRYRFENDHIKDSVRSFGGAGMSFDNGRTTIVAEGGLTTLTFRDPAQKDYHGATGSIGTSRRLATRWTGSLSASRDLDFSIYANNNYYIIERSVFSLSYTATRRLLLLFQSQFARDLYFVPFQGVLRRDLISYNSIGWSYGLRRLRGGFDVGYYDRTSNVPVETQNGIRVVFHLSFTP
jgi:hypothetical protein